MSKVSPWSGPRLRGSRLNQQLGLNAAHALYREDGKWYHVLERFPGVLFDRNGYGIFATREEYERSPYLQIAQELHVPNGISTMPSYQRLGDLTKHSSNTTWQTED